MKTLTQLTALLLLTSLTSCGDDNSFRPLETQPGLSTVETEGEVEEKKAAEKKKCEKKEKAKSCDGYVVDGHGIDEKYIMTVLDYDKSKLEDFSCKDGKIVFCHVPPRNSEAAHYVVIDGNDSSIASHLDKVAVEADGNVYSYMLRCDKYEKKKKKKGGFLSGFFGKKKRHDDDSDDDDCEDEEYEKEDHEYKKKHNKHDD